MGRTTHRDKIAPMRFQFVENIALTSMIWSTEIGVDVVTAEGHNLFQTEPMFLENFDNPIVYLDVLFT